jgi:hypothetical protein
MLAGEKLSENDYGNCNGALDFDSRNTTETMTDEGPLICGFNATYRGPLPCVSPIVHRGWCCRERLPAFSCCLRHIMEVVYHVVVRAMHAPTMCDGRWIKESHAMLCLCINKAQKEKYKTSMYAGMKLCSACFACHKRMFNRDVLHN